MPPKAPQRAATLALLLALAGCAPESNSAEMDAAQSGTQITEETSNAAEATPPKSHRDEEVGYVPADERPEKQAEFSVKFRDEVSPFDVIGVFAMPGETVEIETVFERPDATFTATASGGDLTNVGQHQWRWTAPDEAGLYPIRIVSDATDATVTLNAFTKLPADQIQDGKLGEFRVGTYPEGDEVGEKALYENPDGFLVVTRETKDTQISPHFKLGQFVSKQPSDIPKYVFLHERLLLKLETLINSYNDAGLDVDTFHIMSGYRTPFYNQSIGNVEFSRHVFGDAADIFVDKDGNSRMDDLNGDGDVTYADAQVMADRIEDIFDEPWYQPFVGGLGIYGPAPHRGPFIHVDTRGYKARWTAP